mgnify:CR=1 FL=1
MPEVSVIIPVYNSEKYVEKCICSVMAQTLPELEIIIINDGSIDESGKIPVSYTHLTLPTKLEV